MIPRAAALSQYISTARSSPRSHEYVAVLKVGRARIVRVARRLFHRVADVRPVGEDVVESGSYGSVPPCILCIGLWSPSEFAGSGSVCALSPSELMGKVLVLIYRKALASFFRIFDFAGFFSAAIELISSL